MDWLARLVNYTLWVIECLEKNRIKLWSAYHHSFSWPKKVDGKCFKTGQWQWAHLTNVYLKRTHVTIQNNVFYTWVQHARVTQVIVLACYRKILEIFTICHILSTSVMLCKVLFFLKRFLIVECGLYLFLKFVHV